MSELQAAEELIREYLTSEAAEPIGRLYRKFKVDRFDVVICIKNREVVRNEEPTSVP